MKVQELLTSSDKWTQRTFARDSEGKGVSSHTSSAVCWCILGAINYCYPDYCAYHDALDKVYGALGNRDTDLATYNDSLDRTFADIRKVIEEADV